VPDCLRVLTLNVLTFASADGPARHAVLRSLIRDLDADVIALQEVTRSHDFDQATDLLGTGHTVIDLPGGDPRFGVECLAARLPITEVHTLDRLIAQGHRAHAAAIEVTAPGNLGTVVVVHHKGTYELDLEHVREQQAVATGRFVEDLLRDRPGMPVVMLGDFNAAPDAASMRYLTGRQSLGGHSIRYEDAWEAVHGDEPGHTFTPRNPLVRAGQMPLERGRRIDHILIRSGRHGALLDVGACHRVLSDPVNGVQPSDHFGLLAELRRPHHPPGHWATE
jgi:endonuclease/exonuclease/phosphatase family metal-dependent hydrolase